MNLTYTRLLENINERVPVGEILDQKTFVKLLAKNKAILIRSAENKSFLSVNDFASIISGLKLAHYPYVGGKEVVLMRSSALPFSLRRKLTIYAFFNILGAAPRSIIPVDVPGGDNMIYTANEAPPDQLIPFHHELAQVANPPKYIFFFCDQPPETGGETALIDSTLVYRYANDHFPDFMQKLKKFG